MSMNLTTLLETVAELKASCAKSELTRFKLARTIELKSMWKKEDFYTTPQDVQKYAHLKWAEFLKYAFARSTTWYRHMAFLKMHQNGAEWLALYGMKNALVLAKCSPAQASRVIKVWEDSRSITDGGMQKVFYNLFPKEAVKTKRKAPKSPTTPEAQKEIARLKRELEEALEKNRKLKSAVMQLTSSMAAVQDLAV